ncbi:SirB2 family protein [Enterobacteriaceae bacterium LUAb1]
MDVWYLRLRYFHLFTIFITTLLFILRFFWKLCGSGMLHKRWVRIVPHVNDTCLLLSGIALISLTHFYPFTVQGAWLTEKLLGVILYITLGGVVLSRRPYVNKIRWAGFILALVTLGLIIWLAITKMPLLGIV